MFRNREKQDRSTQRSFLLGERSLRAYLAGGNVRFLEDAEANLSMIGPDAKQYRDARFYLGITKAQLRKADESIEILKKLQESVSSERERGLEVDFADRISLQLAYAHIKKYTDEGFDAAEKILNGLVSSASSKDSADLVLQAKSLQAFLYSVMAGYSKLELQKPEFVRKAFNIGREVLKDPGSTPAVRFEAFNALGIAWMRFAENSQEKVASAEGAVGEDHASMVKKVWEGIGDAAGGWEKAEDFFEQALTIVPNSVRVLQNMATLRLLQVKQGVAKDLSVLLTEAKRLVERSLEVNDQDQFPFYQLTQIAVAEKDKASALKHIREGRNRPGAVKEKSWAAVESAAEALHGQETSPYAQRIYTLQIPVDKVRDLIGPGGKTIRGIIEQTGVKIDVDDSGTVIVASNDGASAAKAIQMINDLTAVPEVGRTYLGTVGRIAEFGAFVEILPGTNGLLHISEIAEHRIKEVSDELKEGDQILVKVLGIEGNRIKLSRKAILREQRAKMATDAPTAVEGTPSGETSKE